MLKDQSTQNQIRSTRNLQKQGSLNHYLFANHRSKREEQMEISGIGNVLGRSKSAISVLDSKHRFIAGSSKCPQKTPHQTTKYHMDGLVRYCNTKTIHNGINNMRILKNPTSLLSPFDQPDVHTATLVQIFDFSTLNTSISHNPFQPRTGNFVHNDFRKKDKSVRYSHVKVMRSKGYFTHDMNDNGDNMYTAENICKMNEFLIDNIFVQFGGCLSFQVTAIPMGTNCASLLAYLFLYSY